MRLSETDTLTQSSYDAGHFPAIDSPTPVFSKPFWKSLVHATRTPEDKVSILSSRKFIISNPNILPGVYTQPDTWLAWDVEEPKRIDIHLLSCNFAHNACNRPIDAFSGQGSVWWNALYCKAARRVGIDLSPADKPDDIEWLTKNDELIRSIDRIGGQRQPWIKAMTVELRNAKVDVLGNGGEFIILNPAVIDWGRTRQENGFISKADNVKAKLEIRFQNVEKVLKSLLDNKLTFSTFRRIPSKRAIVLHGLVVITPDEAHRILDTATKVAAQNDLKIGYDAASKLPGAPEDYGFSEGADGIFWHD